MAVCNIISCTTTGLNKERSLFEIKGEDRQAWLAEIQGHQKKTTGRIYICDLHFDSNDLMKNGKSFRPKKNVLPKCSRNFLNSNNSSNTSASNMNHDPASECINDCPRTEMKSISLEEYRRIVNDATELNRANEKIRKLELLIQQKDDEIKRLEKHLEKAKTISENLSPEQNEVLSSMIQPINNRTKYLPSVRKFCLRMLFHSRAAYNELRHFFNNHLPAHRTMQRWLRCVDASPGITGMALDALAEKVKAYKDDDRELHLCLLHDEASIKRQVCWNDEKHIFEGFSKTIDQNNKNDGKPIPVAKDALVYMVVGPDFRLAVAYFLLNGLDAIDRAVLTKEVVLTIENTGAIVTSLTGDGLPANIYSYEYLGANFAVNRPYFPSPTHAQKNIYIIFDPAHMIKLVRKDFSNHKLFYKNEPLQWNLLVKLAEKQDSENFDLGNKLTKRRHIDWSISPMTVRYAVETISNGVADVLEQLCEDNYSDFIGCQATVKFLRLTNNIFDVMNYGDGKKMNNLFKQPINNSTISKFNELFKEFSGFVNEMSVEVDNKTTTKRVKLSSYFQNKRKSYVGFFGFLQNITSVVGIYNDYIEKGPLDVFHCFQFSQDHLETFFSLIRSSLGCNTNPNSSQFMAAYRKLLLVMPHMSSKHTNCDYFSVSDILTVSSESIKTSHSDIMKAKAIELDTDYEVLISTEIDPYEEHMVAYVASTLEANIIRKLSGCQDCLSVFRENSRICDKLIEKKNVSGHTMSQPCSSTRDIVLACNSVFKILKAESDVDFKIMSKTIWNCLDIEALYDSTSFDSHIHSDTSPFSHKEHFVFQIVDEYLRLKSRNIGRRITDEEWAESMKRRKAKRMKILDGR